MFPTATYRHRRRRLRDRLDTGLVLLPGNGESPMNYADNCYPFRQDSTFLYFLGLDQPDLAAVIDLDSGQHHRLRRRADHRPHRLDGRPADGRRAGGPGRRRAHAAPGELAAIPPPAAGALPPPYRALPC